MADIKKNSAKLHDKKANRRGAARLAAVQALYQMDMAGAGINDVFAEFESHWIGNEVEGDQYLPAEAPAVPPKGQGNLHHLGLELPFAALPTEKTRLEGLGFEVRTGTHPFLPVEAIYIDDPDGNEIELVARK